MPARSAKAHCLGRAGWIVEVLLILSAVAPCLWAGGSGEASDFTFIQASDVHAPMPQSQTTIARITGLGEINLEPFGINVAKPEFAIVTGDLNEFGGGSGWWETYRGYWQGCQIPVYSVLGNHDNTWHANIKALRDRGLGPFYSFESHGWHFVGLMTATPQDPRPSVGEEQILWLKKDLEKVGANTPLVVFFHHPLGGTEFASRYDWERLVDVLHAHNTVLLMAGHSHGHVHNVLEGIDQMTGGSTFGPNAGFAVISVKEGVLRAAYWPAGQPAPNLNLLEKRVPPNVSYPRIELSSPGFRDSLAGPLKIAARVAGAEGIDKATYSVDDELKGDLTLSGKGDEWTASGSANLGDMLPGAHFVRVAFSKGDQRYIRSTEFFLEGTNRATAWRAYLAASSKVTPAIADGVVYVGANDGKLRAFRASTGQELWSADTGAEILAQPLVVQDKVVTANGLGVVSAYTKAGRKLWSFTAGDSVYSSPVMADGKVIFGCNDGKLYALEAATGKQAWVNDDGTYAVESKPFVVGGKVYFGAWDQYIRCVDSKTGKLIWKQLCEGSRNARGAKRYYSPADATPVVAGGKLMIADRSYALTILDAETGELTGSATRVSATGLSEDGRFVYLRKTDGQLAKIDSSGKEIWSVPAHLGAIPTAPTEKNGVVYVASATGLVSAISAEDGRSLWQYQASPQLFVMSSVISDGVNAYVTAFDGTLTAIRTGPKP
jgi:outer membrane protein assembly factor BamB